MIGTILNVILTILIMFIIAFIITFPIIAIYYLLKFRRIKKNIPNKLKGGSEEDAKEDRGTIEGGEIITGDREDKPRDRGYEELSKGERGYIRRTPSETGGTEEDVDGGWRI